MSSTKGKSESSIVLLLASAFFMASFGCFLGLIYLMSFPLEPYTNKSDWEEAMKKRQPVEQAPADAPDQTSGDTSDQISSDAFVLIPGDAYYIEGPTDRNTSWQGKRQQLIDGSASTIEVSVGEINAWFAAKFRSSAINDDEASGLAIVPDLPNIGITDDGTTYINLPAKISGYGMDGEYIFSAKVGYDDGAPASLSIDHLQVGGAAIPLPGVLGASIVSRIMNAFSSAEEYAVMQEAWNRVKSVEITGDGMILSLNAP